MPSRSADRARSRRGGRARVVVALLTVLASIVALGAPAAQGESTADQLHRLRAQIAAAQRSADDISARYERTYARLSVLDDQIAAANAQIRLLTRALEVRHDVLRQRASQLYIRGSLDSASITLHDDGHALTSMRAAVLVESADQHDQKIIDAFRATSEDLTARRHALERTRTAQRALSKSQSADMQRINAQLAKLGGLQRELERRFAKEEAARKAAEAAARARAAAAARAAADAARRNQASHARTPPRGGTSGGTYGLQVCPVNGPVAFADTWGDPRPGGRHHQGVDMLAPFGTPDVAVAPGRIEFRHGVLEGLGIFLYADNGNTYYYFHLSSYVGAPRHVHTGETIGHVGSTGESGANHTHFEIHPGGGPAVDPYPAVRAVC